MPSITPGDQKFFGTFMGSLANLRWTSSHFSVPKVTFGGLSSPFLFSCCAFSLFGEVGTVTQRSVLSDKILSDSSHLAPCTQVSIWPGEFVYFCHATW